MVSVLGDLESCQKWPVPFHHYVQVLRASQRRDDLTNQVIQQQSQRGPAVERFLKNKIEGEHGPVYITEAPKC
jgi:hypothetical protein